LPSRFGFLALLWGRFLDDFVGRRRRRPPTFSFRHGFRELLRQGQGEVLGKKDTVALYRYLNRFVGSVVTGGDAGLECNRRKLRNNLWSDRNRLSY